MQECIEVFLGKGDNCDAQENPCFVQLASETRPPVSLEEVDRSNSHRVPPDFLA